MKVKNIQNIKTTEKFQISNKYMRSIIFTIKKKKSSRKKLIKNRLK